MNTYLYAVLKYINGKKELIGIVRASDSKEAKTFYSRQARNMHGKYYARKLRRKINKNG